jgi:hypothetical protein
MTKRSIAAVALLGVLVGISEAAFEGPSFDLTLAESQAREILKTGGERPMALAAGAAENGPSSGVERACYQRDADERADKMGMPKSFCIDSMKVEYSAVERSQLTVKGSPLQGTFPVKIEPAGEGLYKASAGIFGNREGSVCDEVLSAHIAVSVTMDKNGNIKPGSVQVEAETGYTYDSCHSPWEWRSVVFTQTR